MDENMNFYQEESGLKEVVSRYEGMLRANTPSYFDVHEFERIVDHYLDTEKYPSAVEAVNHAISQHPSSTGILLKKAQVLAESGKPGDGLNYIYKIERIEQANPDLFILKGSILTQLGKIEKAENAFKSALNMTFENKEEVLLDIALIYESVKQYKQALKYLKEAQQIKPEKSNILFELAYCHERLTNYSQARDNYKKYLDVKPFSANGWYNLGMLYFKVEDYTNAIECFDFTVALNDKNVSAHLNKAGALVNLEKYEDAIVPYGACLEIDDQNPMFYTYIGECYEKIDKYEMAISQYKQAIEFDERFHEAWYGIGVSYLYLKQLSDSLYYLNKAILLDKENPDYWFTLGNVHTSMGSPGDAVKAYSQVEILDPYDFEAWINHAELEFKRSGPLKAIGILKESYTYNFDIPVINYHLSAYYYLSGEKDLSLTFFDKALRQNKDEKHLSFKICREMKDDKKIVSLIAKSKNQ